MALWPVKVVYYFDEMFGNQLPLAEPTVLLKTILGSADSWLLSCDYFTNYSSLRFLRSLLIGLTLEQGPRSLVSYTSMPP